MNCFGDNILKRFGCLLEIRIQGFFHQRASQRQLKNHISGIFNKDGTWRTSEDHIAQIAEQYFQELFSLAHPMGMESVLDSMNSIITPDMNSSLL